MTVESTAFRAKHDCNGSVATFSFSFGVGATDEIQVIVTDTNGVETILVENSNYEVVLAENGGTVSTIRYVGETKESYAYPSGYTITILGNVPLSQAIDFTEGYPTLYEAFEQGLDKLTRIALQMSELSNRMPRLAKTSSYSALTLPDPLAGYVLQWNAGLTGLQNTLLAAGDYLLPIRDLSEFDDFETAVATIADNPTTLRISSAVDLTDDVETPLTLLLWFPINGIKIDSTTNKTLTIKSPSCIVAQPGQQIFGPDVTVASVARGIWHPGWFGNIDPTGTSDSATAIQACFDILVSGDTVKFPEGTIRVDTACSITGIENLTLIAYGTKFVSASDIRLFDLNDSAAVARNIKWLGGFFEHDDGTSSATNNTATAIGIDDIRDLTIKDVHFGGTAGKGWHKCIAGGVKDNAKIYDNYAYACDHFFDLDVPPSGGVAQIISIFGNNIPSNFDYAINLNARFSDVWIERNSFSSDKHNHIYAVTGSGLGNEESTNLIINNNTFEQLLAGDDYINIFYDSANYLDGLKVTNNQFVATAACITGDRIKDLHVVGNNFANSAAIAIAVTNCMGTIKVKDNFFAQTTSGTPGTIATISAAAGEFYRTIWGGNEYTDWNDLGTLSVPFERFHNTDTPVFFGPFNSYQGDATELLKGNLQSDTYDGGDFSTGSADVTVYTDAGVDSIWWEQPVQLMRAVYMKIRARDSGSAGAACGVTAQPKMTEDWDDADMTLHLTGVPNDNWRSVTGWVPVNSAGQITLEYTATGSDTLEIDIYYLGYR